MQRIKELEERIEAQKRQIKELEEKVSKVSVNFGADSQRREERVITSLCSLVFTEKYGYFNRQTMSPGEGL